MRIALSSDNHLDINQVEASVAVAAQASFLRSEGVDWYVNAGDTYNRFDKTLTYYHALQDELGQDCQVRFVAGNHDVLAGADYQTIETLADPLYLHGKRETLPGTNMVLVGDNGWYDYSFAPKTLTPAKLMSWKRAYWLDAQADQPVTDAERMAAVLARVRKHLQECADKRILLVTHFVPDKHFLNPKLLADPVAGRIAAFLGSQALGDLLATHGGVTTYFGHLHHRDAPAVWQGVQYYHRPLGYGTDRRREWTQPDFSTEWQQTLTILDI